MTCKNVIAKNHCYIIIANKISADNKCLCQSIRTWLYCIRQLDSKLMTIT